MGEGRNLELEIERKARKKAMKDLILIILLEVVLFLIIGATSGWYTIYQLIGMSVPILIINICGFLLLRKNYMMEAQSKRKHERVEEIVPISTYVEVMPTDQNNCKDFMEKEKEKGFAKFYAIRNEKHQIIEIKAKFSGEDEMYPFTAVVKERFEDEYVTVKEKTE